ncbi:MAG: hypothetical protein H7210_00565 [Pyrinomonadaceae bacterium]|nr:hypothetical protein [Phycisphaerales bacterium]
MAPVANPIKCLACGYDLAGLPSVTCPECGGDTAEIQRLDALRRMAGRKVSRHWLLVASVLIAIIGTLDSRDVSGIKLNWLGDYALRFDWLTFGLAAIPFFAWLELGRRARSAMNPSIHLAAMPIMMVTWNWLTWASSLSQRMSFPSIACIAYILLLTWLMSNLRTIWSLAMALTVTAILWIGSIWAVSAVRLGLGLEWGIVSDTRAGQIYQQYPLRNEEVIATLTTPLVGSVLALVVILGVRRISRSRIAARSVVIAGNSSPRP